VAQLVTQGRQQHFSVFGAEAIHAGESTLTARARRLLQLGRTCVPARSRASIFLLLFLMAKRSLSPVPEIATKRLRTEAVPAAAPAAGGASGGAGGDANTRCESASAAPAPADALCVLHDVFVPVLINTNEWDALAAWKDVSRATRERVECALRTFLRPRLTALGEAVPPWLTTTAGAPAMLTRFPFPTPRGPLSVGWVSLLGEKRTGARPLDACLTERPMPRGLFVWAIERGLCWPADAAPWPRVDIPAALAVAEADSAGAGDTAQLDCEPAYLYFKNPAAPQWSNVHDRWQHAHEHSVLSLLATFTCWSYTTGRNMGAPGNRQYFFKALLKQVWPARADIPAALAFLLFWAQHTTFATWVIDQTFLQSAIYLLAVELVLEWRGVRPECVSRADIDMLYAHPLYTHWFASRADELHYLPHRKPVDARAIELHLEFNDSEEAAQRAIARLVAQTEPMY
jgi:hypothetical protein